ncbi:PREDICTED: uncharacterized protein LOC105149091 [Acromyrmex echinatior]|uniref:uncharacterized protein LOC105149091 n=2 Tax=Acromyrmex echinatior TaxID=103372 RepID=UPI000580EE22|nr:PREDICTED: uncharacterized protein LOC105149091 [Acromyrmex echinatior]
MLTLFAVITVSICTLGQHLSNSFIVLPKNISHLPIMMEYFIDQEKYFYLILLHFYAITCVGGIAILAVGTLLLTYLQYICGMFKIAGYRIEHAININVRQNITPKNKILMNEGIICAVDIHRQAMKLSKHLLSTFEVMMFCLIIFGVACLTLNLFQVSFLFRIVICENACKCCSEIMCINNPVQ